MMRMMVVTSMNDEDYGCHLYVTLGDMLVMEMSLVSFDERLGFATMTGKAYVGGRVSDCGDDVMKQ